MKQYVNKYPRAKSFLKLAKWEEWEAKDFALARKIYESALINLGPEEARQARVFKMFAVFKEQQGEYQRARIITHAIKLLKLGKTSITARQADEDGEELSIYGKERHEELYKSYVAFEKKHDDHKGIEDVVLTKQRAEYDEHVGENPLDYDTWFELPSWKKIMVNQKPLEIL